jgi:hypothetical protein
LVARVGIIVGGRIDGVEGPLGTADGSGTIGCDKVGIGVGSFDPTGGLVRTAAGSIYSVGKLMGIVEGVTETTLDGRNVREEAGILEGIVDDGDGPIVGAFVSSSL